MTELFKSWLAGYIDGDGCFSLSLSRQHNAKTQRICVTPQIGITSRADRKEHLEYIQKSVGIGKIYTRGKSSHPQCAWQTTSVIDGLTIAKLVYPYLKVKKEKARKFIKVLEYWYNTVNPNHARTLGSRTRTQEDMKKIIKVACSINSDRSTRRYKNKLTYEEWVPVIEELYPKGN